MINIGGSKHSHAHTSELRSNITKKIKIKYLHNRSIEDSKLPNQHYEIEISEYPKKPKPKHNYFLK